MGKEIERKFLVEDSGWRDMVEDSLEFVQGYLSTSPSATVRLRIVKRRSGDNNAFLTVKGRSAVSGLTRDEWEYPIPVTDAEAMIKGGCIEPDSLIIKTRHIIDRWEIDEFHGSLEGLVMAEVELCSELEPLPRLPFRGVEVTGDSRYYNSRLAKEGIPPRN
ncbi:MAG: CYTH domain-containing protein [Paramuribaculum sp.]|nr:CYTH domain-containing protein [Paramuribaculum sp.]MDE6304577.1 CYTH domain-containing protein [Paramuribaculum sp.]